MSAAKCHICKVKPADSYGVCPGCKPVQSICSTSAEDGVRYGIPGTSLADLQRALAYEKKHSGRTTVITALNRAIKKAGLTK